MKTPATLEVLMSTMHRNDPRFALDTNLQCSCLIVNQCDFSASMQTAISGQSVRMISVTDRGLSRSRNLALANAEGDICLLADDDVTFARGYVDTVKRAYAEHPDADIITFQVARTGGDRALKSFSPRSARLRWRGVLRVSSVEITMRLDSVRRANLKFDTRFGAGSRYQMGEESVLLFDALRQGLRIVYVPELIATTDVTESSWFAGFDDRYFESRGAVFRRMSPRWYPTLILAFALRKRPLYHGDVTLTESVRAMLRGARQFRP